jgi:phage-related protein
MGNAYRLIYMAKFAEAVYVLHAFQKKSRKTARTDMELARLRFRALVRDRRRR